MRRLTALLLLLLGTACASVPPSPPPTAAVRAAMEGFMEALNGLDLEGMAKFFADDITVFVPLAQPERAEGKPAVVEIFRRYVETTRATTSRTNLVPEDLLIDVRGETAVVSFHMRSADAVARRTFVFHEQDGRWLITHFHASSFSLSAGNLLGVTPPQHPEGDDRQDESQRREPCRVEGWRCRRRRCPGHYLRATFADA